MRPLSLILYSSVGPSVEADSFDPGDQGFVRSLGISGSSAGREFFLTTGASHSGWGATLPPHWVSGVGLRTPPSTKLLTP